MLKRQKLSYLIIGVLIGVLVSFSFAYANSNIVRLIVDGEDITYSSDVPPQIINGRTLIPARILSEKLGATVDWNEKNKTVIVTSKKNNIIKNEVTETDAVKETTYKCLPAIEVNGETYFDSYRYNELIHKIDSNSNIILQEVNQNKIMVVTLHKKQTIIPVTNENIQIHYGKSYINVKFYRE